MAGGGLIILPHKTWNPYGREQRERVKKDEREHREKEEAKAKRTREVDQEHRLETLRKRQLGPGTDATDLPSAPPPSIPATGNSEYMQEAADKKAREERQYVTYLGQSSAEMAKDKPWYYAAPDVTRSTTALDKEKRAQAKALRHRDRADPLLDMKLLLAKEKDNAGLSGPRIRVQASTTSHAPPRASVSRREMEGDDDSRQHESRHRSKKSSRRDSHRRHHRSSTSSHGGDGKRSHRRHSRRDKTTSSPDTSSRRDSSAQLARLRAERVAREQQDEARLRLTHPELFPAPRPPSFSEKYEAERNAQRTRQQKRRGGHQRSRYNSGYASFHGGHVKS